MNETAVSDPFELRHAATDRAVIVNVPERRLLAVDGVGSPAAEDYRLASLVLRSVSTNLAARLRHHGVSTLRPTVLETAWWVHPELPPNQTADAFEDRSIWHWQQMVEIPRAANDDDIDAAIDQTRREAGRQTPLVRLISFEEGLSAQTLIVGRLTAASDAVRRLFAAVAEAGLEPRGHLHELHLANTETVPPERARTILRLPVEPTSQGERR
jgi:hypothetical protein